MKALLERMTILRPDDWPRGSGKILLTFDDGPSPVTTPGLLDVLAKHQVTATFCQIGVNIANWPELTRRVVEEGHELAVHSYTHSYRALIRRRTVREEIERWQALVREVLENPEWQPRIYRSPGGLTTLAVRRVLREKRLLQAFLTFFVNDANAGPADGPRVVIRNRRKLIANNGGALVLHEMRYTRPDDRFAIDKSWLPQALGEFLTWARAEGFTFTGYC